MKTLRDIFYLQFILYTVFCHIAARCHWYTIQGRFKQGVRDVWSVCLLSIASPRINKIKRSVCFKLRFIQYWQYFPTVAPLFLEKNGGREGGWGERTHSRRRRAESKANMTPAWSRDGKDAQTNVRVYRTQSTSTVKLSCFDTARH